MSTPTPNDDMKALRALMAVEPPRELGDRVRRQARGELEAASAGSWLTTATRAWTRVGLPAALAVTVVLYLSWAVTSASALYR
ncbi:MAG TPA: hypothetical protein VGL81_25430 [Polyangiaceae bacterium]|jgi:hypothetical protein